MKRELSFVQSALIICITAVLLIVTLAYLKVSAAYGLLASTLLSSVFAFLNGYTLNEIFSFITDGIKKFYSFMVIMLLIGITTGVWLYCGIIPATVYYGLYTIDPSTFLLSAFFICTVLSIILGTGVGTVSTVGVALMIIGKGLLVPDHITAGAIVSGSFIGCRTSLMSPISILAAKASETNLRDMLKYSLTTLIPSIILTILFFFVISLNINILNDKSSINALMETIYRYYNISLWLIIPPLMIIVLSLLKVPISITLLAGLASGALIGLLSQDVSIHGIFNSGIFGYKASIDPKLAQIIKGGGARSMLEMLAIIVAVSAFNGVLSGTKVLDSLLKNSIGKLKESKKLILYTLALSSITAVFGCTQIIAIVIPSQFLISLYKNQKISRLVLARSISDSGVMLSAIIPWNVCALVPSAIMGVSVLQYAPFAIICYLMLIINVVYTLAGLYKKDAATNYAAAGQGLEQGPLR